MANLPTAHASQSFGRKSIDFYAAPGQVIGSDPRARSDERRIQDSDGARHAVRLSENRAALSPGDMAAVLRVQPGPARKSRPVAVINYTEQSWTRTQPEAGALLSRAGVARNINWLFSVLTLIAVMLVMLWPEMRAFAAEIHPASFAALPGFDIFAVIAERFPDLGAWRLSDSFAGLIAGLESSVPALAGHGASLLFAAGVALGGVIAFSARSWRLLWVPMLVAAILVGAIGLAGPRDAVIPALLALSGVALLFVAGGIVNRARDGWRLEQRIARLADHLLRHPPEEMVTSASAHAGQGSETLVEAPETGETAGEPASGQDAPRQRRSATSLAAAAAARAAEEAGISAPRPAPNTEAPPAGEAAGEESEPAREHAGQGEEAEPAARHAEPAAETVHEPADEASTPDSFVAREEEEEMDASGHHGEVRGQDPRHDARDISLPPPPPMPRPTETLRPDGPFSEIGVPAQDDDEREPERS